MFAKLRPILCSRSFGTKIKTVDPSEIKHFDVLAEKWWGTKTVAPLHALNEVRVPFIQNRLAQIGVTQSDAKSSTPLRGLSILDVGCGGGILTEALSRLGGNITGLDASKELINIAKSHAKTQDLPNLKYVCSTIQDHTIDNREKYDVVISSETIEHVTEKEYFVKHCVECLKPGGSIFITTPNKTWLSGIYVIFVLEKVLGRIPRGTHTYDMFIHINDLKQTLNKENCKVVGTQGLMYNVLKNKWHLVEFESVFYGIHAIKQV